MIPLRLDEIAYATGGRLDGGAAPDATVTGPVVVDSRAVEAGSLFVAIRGEHVDGHDFAPAAHDKGAAAVLAGRPVGVPAVVVTDPAVALGAVAAAVLRRLPSLTVVGVTGSAGKTSTKDLLGAVFAAAGKTVAPAGNLNNELGLPLTVTRAEPDTRTLVLEYGARGLGHIRYLTTIAPPTIGVVLNVGAAHVGEFGSRELIAQAKGELVEALPPNGFAILNADDDLVAAMASRTAATVLTFGTREEADVRVDDLTLDDSARPSFTLRTPSGDASITLGLYGAHHALNAAAAMAAGLAAGVPLAAAADALSKTTARSPHRMDVRRRDDGAVVIDDAYNASPESTAAALRALAKMQAAGKRWAVLGPMRELGETSEAAHREIGRLTATLGVDRVVVVGADAAGVATGATSVGGWPGEVAAVATVDDALVALKEVAAGDVVLVKASNAARLWRIADALVGERIDG